MLQALITILILCVFIGLIYWVLDAIPVPQPLNRWAKIALIVIGAIALIIVLANMAGFSTGLSLR